MAEFFNFIASIFRSFFTGMSQLINGYPRFFATVVCGVIFLYALKFVVGFGELVVNVVALVILIGLARMIFVKK